MQKIRLKLASDLGEEKYLIVTWGLELLNKIKEDLSDISQVDQEASLEGRQLLMVLSPLKSK